MNKEELINILYGHPRTVDEVRVWVKTWEEVVGNNDPQDIDLLNGDEPSALRAMEECYYICRLLLAHIDKTSQHE